MHRERTYRTVIAHILGNAARRMFIAGVALASVVAECDVLPNPEETTMRIARKCSRVVIDSVPCIVCKDGWGIQAISCDWSAP